MELKQHVIDLVNEVEKDLVEEFKKVDEIALYNQKKVLDAFSKNQVGQRHLAQTNGYGYDDIGRDTLCKIYADTFHTESAIVSPLIVSGTHALTLCLFGILRPGDELMSITGEPYDTLQEVIKGTNIGSLNDFKISYKQVDLLNGKFDTNKILSEISDKTKLIYITRSRGYSWRDALSCEEIAEIANLIKAKKKDVVIMCDNCYGEFTNKIEPTECENVDMICGSLIKNPGGGLAPTGGYVAGKKEVVDQVAYRLTAPSIGMEVGSYAYGYKDYYQGFFMSPHVVANCIKGSILMGRAFEKIGFETMPKIGSQPNDIIRSIKFDTEEQLVDFIRSIQEVSPIDSYVTPFAWDMPGYEDQVIMAAGTFVGGASIELSADSPIKAPYIAYVQGGLTYEHVKIATIYCLGKVLK